MLGLDICADIMVGGEMKRGISGGQKKRLTTGYILFYYILNQQFNILNIYSHSFRTFSYLLSCIYCFNCNLM